MLKGPVTFIARVVSTLFALLELTSVGDIFLMK